MPGDIDREGYRSLPSQVPSTSQGKSKWKEGSKAGFSVVADYGTCQEVAVRSALSESGRVKLPALLQLVDAERFPSPSTAKKRIRQGAVLVNGRKGKVDTLVAIGADRVTLQVRTESAYKPLGKAPFEIEVIYEDDYMAVVRKPAGVCTHPPKGGIKASSVSDGDEDEDGEEDEDEDEVREEDEQEGELRHRKDGRMDMMSMRSCIGFHVSCAPAGMEGVLWRPMLVHRLDKATEGLQVVAKTKPAYIGLQRQFAKRLIKKQYAAVVEGEVQGDAGVIDLAVDHKAAVSRWQVAARYRSPALGGSHLTLLHVWPQHGRKHQIRLHCARGLGCSIVGDHRYGGTLVRPYGLLLCAIGLELKHPMTGVDLSLSLPLPDRFLAMPRQVLQLQPRTPNPEP